MQSSQAWRTTSISVDGVTTGLELCESSTKLSLFRTSYEFCGAFLRFVNLFNELLTLLVSTLNSLQP
jgi:hypothetical protein